jgi:CRISPR-associated protein Csm4
VAAITGHPFKRPVLTLRTSAFLTFRNDRVPAFHGTGLGGTRQPLSAAIPATVHQGYAPLVPLNAELRQ